VIDTWRRIRRDILFLTAIVIILFGIVLTPLPIPLGVPVMLAGGVLLLRHSIWAKRHYIYLRAYAQQHWQGLAVVLHHFERLVRRRKPRKTSR
jgi:hypothetical protein